MFEAATATSSRVFGQDPIAITAWATVALAFVGIVGIVTGALLAYASLKQARAAGASNDLQKQELDLLQSQLDLTRQELSLRSAVSDEERKRLVRDAQVNLDVSIAGGQYAQGTPPRNVAVNVVVTNHGPGVAANVFYGIRRNDWETVVNRRPLILGVDKALSSLVEVPDTAVADATFLSAQGDPLAREFTGWVRYSDATGKEWETTSDGKTSPLGPKHTPA